MAYAQLVFPSTPQAGQVLKAIARVLLGEKSLTAIEGLAPDVIFDQYGLGIGSYKSEIVNPLSEAWTLVYPIGLPIAGNFALSTFTVSSPCLTATKSKFVRFMIANASGLFTEPTNSAATLYSTTLNYTIYGQGLTSIDASGNATNLSWRNSDGTQAVIKKQGSTSQPYVVWISWSARHLFVVSSVSISNSLSSRCCTFGAFEFDETSLTKYSNSAPVAYIAGNANGTLISATTASTASGFSVNLLGTYDPVVSATVAVRALTNTTGSLVNLSTLASTGIAMTDQTGLLNAATFINNRKNWATVPILYNDTDHGNGNLNLTKYSNIWVFPNAGYENGLFTASSGDIYKSINLYDVSGSTLTSTILVKYG